MIGLITYRKIEILLRTYSSDKPFPSSQKVEFENAKLTLTGDFMIISHLETKEMVTLNEIFSLDNVITYRTTL